MKSYKLQNRVVLSFVTGVYEDGDIDYTYIVHVYLLLFNSNCIEAVMLINRCWHLHSLAVLCELSMLQIIQPLQQLIQK